MKTRTLCIHGHFYQPPREHPFSGVIPPEGGAAPFANFNEKITAECYAPNARAGNFHLLSFNLGPTLAQWLAGYDGNTYHQIVEADRQNVRRWGVGNALAQAYNHTILPLAHRRDKETQIAWGIADFHHRFGRLPQGMWLPEMAVDLETLEVMAEQGIEFTVLSVRQARQSVDVARPYWVRLPAGRRMAVFFRHEDLSNRLAFDPYLTERALRFAELLDATVNGGGGLYLIATDGETFGHHQPGRERFVTDLLTQLAPQRGYQVGYLAHFLRQNPAVEEVEIWEHTAWSCWHGLARWREGCSCTSGGSRWKGILRQAMDRLAWEIDALFLAETYRRVADPWSMRREAIRVWLGQESGPSLVARHAGGGLTSADQARLLTLLEAQRYRQAMYTSCGWFFDDLGRIEPGLVIAYAAKAIQLVRQACGIGLEKDFRKDLSQASSAVTGQSGAGIYDRILAQAVAASAALPVGQQPVGEIQ
ncbi:MAG: DUF3536 domain-containing protein [Chloroflexota bacterium]